ncbi:MAG: hypothetical protein AUG44_08690 [Actinobacteria bacterium 13_1_20CM_3_71_11]|nr:MAG: hypothetical protein AUG44_08690 [Actinobacteria bacterium 13_1_20CM_3_71_11]
MNDTRAAYRTREAAKLLGIPYRTVMTLINNGQLGAVRASRYYLVPAEEIDRFLAPAKHGPA